MNSVILQFPGSIYAMETRNPGPMYANKFFQLLLCKKENIHIINGDYQANSLGGTIVKLFT